MEKVQLFQEHNYPKPGKEKTKQHQKVTNKRTPIQSINQQHNLVPINQGQSQ